MLDDLLPEKFPVDMCVDFRRSDGFVPEHRLDGPQVGPSFQQVGGKRMTEGVRTDGAVDARRFGILPDVAEDRDAREVLAPAVADEDVVVLALSLIHI